MIGSGEVERVFRDAGAFREGHFVLASGKHSPKYLEKFQVLQWPRETERLCAAIAEQARMARPDTVAGPTTGGSVQETIDAVRSAGASVIAAAVLVDRSGGGAQIGVPLHALWSLDIATYSAAECPLCAQGTPVMKPGTTPAQAAHA